MDPSIVRPVNRGVTIYHRGMVQPRLERSFRAARYAVQTPDSQVEFRIGGAIEALRGREFALLTAFNPAGIERDASENQEAQRRLRDELASRPFTVWPASSNDSNGGHHEDQFAVFGISKGEAVSLAEAFGQAAIVWFDGQTAELVWTDEAEPERAP
jgi:hypothetical protein